MNIRGGKLVYRHWESS